MKRVHSDIVQFRGSHYDFGRMQGELLKESLILPNRQKQRQASNRHLIIDEQRAKNILVTLAPQVWEEITGLADALDWSMHEAIREFGGYYLEYTRSGCSIYTESEFMVRNYDMSLSHAGLTFGIASGVFAATGSMFSGYYCDKLSQKDCRWQLRMPAIGVLISIPFGLAFLLWPAGAFWQLGSLKIPHAIIFAAGFSFFNSWWPTLAFAAVSHLVNSFQRATSIAILSLFLTFFGAGIGPLLTGTLSDLFSVGDAGEGLKYAIAVMIALSLFSVWFYYKAIGPYQQRIASKVSDNDKTAQSYNNKADCTSDNNSSTSTT